MAKTKVALVLSGGISLGSYIAGALDELMHALSAAADRFEIDIITGASAGATTGALIAHGLLYHGGQPRLYETWVEQLDITGLLAPPESSDERFSVFNGAFVEKVALQALMWGDNDVEARAPFCAEALILAMTMANTTPLAYVSRVPQPTAGAEEAFLQYRHAEQEAFVLGQDVRPHNRVTWERIGDVARASSAFPFAFPRVRLARHAEDPLQYIHRPAFRGEKAFWYYDGGTFNNLPIDLAWHYAHRDGGIIDDRKIVVISPSRSRVKPLPADPPYPNLLSQLSSFIGGVFTESRSIQFSREIAPPIRQTEPGNLESFPGVDDPPAEVIARFALVIPQQGAPPLRGSYFHGFSAFLDRRFRAYDFRRGAADAREVARQNLGITYDAGRPPGFYAPDDDPSLQINHDLGDYESLGQIPRFGDEQRTVRDVFEEAMAARIDALLEMWNAPGWDAVIDPILAHGARRLAAQHLPSLWRAAD